MKKVILSMVCVFAFSTLVNAAIVSERNCVEEAMAEGDKADEAGLSYEEAYDKADLAYLRCEADNN